MPKLYLPVPEVDKSMTRPVILDIISQLKDITAIDQKTQVLFLGDAKSSLQPGSPVDPDIMDNTKIAAYSQLSIEVTESYNEGNIGNVAIAQTEQIPIFTDHDLGIVLKPIYTSRVYDIRVAYRNPSRTNAKAWRDRIYMHVNQLRDINLHVAKYHYGIPKAFIVLLTELYRLRENVAGYNDDWDRYFISNCKRELTEITTLTGSSVDWAIAEQQIRVQGTFDFTGSPEKEQMGGETNMWMSDFTYRVTMDVPTGMHMQYPIMVHNQLLDDRYIPKPSEDDTKHYKSFTHSLRALHRFEVPYDNDRMNPWNEYSHYPQEDDWYPDQIPTGMKMIYSSLCQVDPSDPKLIVSLKELGEWMIDEEVLEYFTQVEYKYLTIPYQSPYHVTYYRHKFLTRHQDVSVTSRLELRSKEDLSLRDTHRLAINLVADIDLINPEAFKRMKRYPNVLRKTLMALHPSYNQLAKYSSKVNLLPYAPHLVETGVNPDAVWQNYRPFFTVLSAEARSHRAH